jgi:hypothetical protein
MDLAVSDSLPPPIGISLVGQDGVMVTSPLSLWQGLQSEGVRFDTPDVFHPRWGALIRDRFESPSSIPPPMDDLKRTPSVPPPGPAREKVMGIVGRSIYKELCDLGYNSRQMVQVATGLIALINEMMAERKGERRDRRAEESEGEEGAFREDLRARYKAVFLELIAAGCAYADLTWVASSGLLAQVIQRMNESPVTASR